MLQIFKSKSPLIGVDISSTSVKLLELSHRGDSYQVESYAVVPLPPGVVVEKNIKDSDTLAEIIRKTLIKSQSSAKFAAVALPDSAVINKIIQLDKSLSDEEMEMQIMLESDKFIPYPLEEVRLDFDVLSQADNHPDLVDVMVVASRAENVNIRVDALAESGLDVKVVDVESYAIERACHLVREKFPNQGQNELIAVVDIGSVMTSLTVLHDMNTIFSREDIFGGEQLTKAIQRHYGLSYSEAGLAKKQGGMPEDYITEVLNPFKDAAVLQVRRALQVFFSTSQYTNVSHIILAGGSVRIEGLAELIEEQIGISTSIADPFENMSVSNRIDQNALKNDASALMMCCGLAMRGMSEWQT